MYGYEKIDLKMIGMKRFASFFKSKEKTAEYYTMIAYKNKLYRYYIKCI